MILIAAAVISLAMSGPYGSIHHGLPALKRLLPLKVEGDHFTLHVAEQNHAYALRLAREASFHISELTRELKISAPHVFIFVYPDERSKKLWFGAGSTDVTDVVTPSIHIVAEGYPHPTLRHELVHALTSDIAFFGLGFHPNLALTEGLAVALAPGFAPLDLDERAATLFHTGKALSLDALMSPLFWRESGERAYSQAGSLIRYLISEFGVEWVMEVYRGVTPTNLEDAFTKWQTHVVASYPKDSKNLARQTLFQRPSVLDDTCPHSRADLEHNDMFTRWRHDKSLKGRSLGVSDSIKKQAKIALKDKNYDLIAHLASQVPSLERGSHPSSEDLEALLLKSDLLRLGHKKEESLSLLLQLESYAKSFKLPDSLIRAVFARTYTERTYTEDEAKKLRGYLAGFDTLPSVNDWFKSYLALRRGDPRAQTWQEEPASGFPLSYYEEWDRLKGELYFKEANYHKSAEAYGRASLYTTGERKRHFAELNRLSLYLSQLPSP